MGFTRKIQDDAWDERFNSSTKGICCYCKREIRINDCHYDHKISTFNGGLDTLENCEPICHKCNVLKGDRNKDEFMRDLYPTEIQIIEKRIELIDKNIDDKTKLFEKEIIKLNDQRNKLINDIKNLNIKDNKETIYTNKSISLEKDHNVITQTINKNHKKPKMNISGFIFNEKVYETNIVKNILRIVCDNLASENKDFSEKIKSINSLVKEKVDCKYPYNIKNTNIYIETNLSSDGVIHYTYYIMKLFGYEKDKLIIKYI